MARKKTDNTPTKPRRSRPIDLSSFLEGIGPPEPTSFSLDPWQEEAIEKIQHGDVIVSVPTGSGKTYVAVEAARHAMAAEKTVLYTSPLKALSNTKFTEFSKIFGPDRVGILTGERRVHPYAEMTFDSIPWDWSFSMKPSFSQIRNVVSCGRKPSFFAQRKRGCCFSLPQSATPRSSPPGCLASGQMPVT